MATKTMLPFTYHEPATVEELLKLLDTYSGSVKLIAGGTDLIPKMKARVAHYDHVVSVKGIPELNYARYEEDGLHIGCAITLHDLEMLPVVQEKYPALFDGVHSIASTQIRNSGTMVGNICNAVPSADSAPALVALNAQIHAVSSNGSRMIPADQFFTGVCKTVLEPNELVTEVIVPAPKKNSGCHYISYTLRKALDLAMVGSAVQIEMEGEVCKDIRIALGAVAPTPKRAPAAESVLRGKVLTEELVREAAEKAASEDCSPITDMRATQEYRREIVKIITRDAILKAAERAHMN